MDPRTAFHTYEQLYWEGTLLEVSDLTVSHGFSPVPKDISPGQRVPLSVACKARLNRAPRYDVSTSLAGGDAPKAGDAAELTLFMESPDGSTKESLRMDLLVDEIEYEEQWWTLKLIQKIDTFSTPVSIDPLIDTRPRYQSPRDGTETKEPIGDVGEIRSLQPSALWPTFWCLRAAGYYVTPPTVPTVELDLPMQGSWWNNQWDAPHYTQNPRRDATLVSPWANPDVFQQPYANGLSSRPGYGAAGIGFSGTVARARSNADKAVTPTGFYHNGVEYMGEGLVQVAADRDRALSHPHVVKRGHIFASFMVMLNEKFPPVGGTFFQVKICTSAKRAIAVRWNDAGNFWIYYSIYPQKWVGFKATQELLVKQFKVNWTPGEHTVVLIQDGNTIELRVGELHTEKILTGNITDDGGSLPSWVEVWANNPSKTQRMGVCGVQVASIPMSDPHKKRFLDYVEGHHKFKPTARIDPGTRMLPLRYLPSLRRVPAGTCLDDICSTLGYAWWVGEDGTAQVMPIEKLLTWNPYNAVPDIVASRDVKSFKISSSLQNTRASVTVEYAKPSVIKHDNATETIFEGKGEVAIGQTVSMSASPSNDEDWIDPDYTVEVMDTQDFRWLESGVGSFYGGSTEVEVTQKSSDLESDYDRTRYYSSIVEFKLNRPNPWTADMGVKGLYRAIPKSKNPLVEYKLRDGIKLYTPTHCGITVAPNKFPVGLRVPQTGLPVLRAVGTVTKTKDSVTWYGGPRNAGSLVVDGTDFITDAKQANEAARVISAEAVKSTPQIKSLVVRYDIRYRLGKSVRILGSSESGIGAVFGAELKGIIYFIKHNPGAGETELGVYTIEANAIPKYRPL